MAQRATVFRRGPGYPTTPPPRFRTLPHMRGARAERDGGTRRAPTPVDQDEQVSAHGFGERSPAIVPRRRTPRALSSATWVLSLPAAQDRVVGPQFG